METFFQFMQAGSMVVFLYLFVKGDIVSKKTLDYVLKELVAEMLAGVKEAVYEGHLKADAQINGRKK